MQKLCKRYPPHLNNVSYITLWNLKFSPRIRAIPMHCQRK